MQLESMDIGRLNRDDYALMESLLRRYERHRRPLDLHNIADLVTKHAFAAEAVLFPIARRLFVEANGITCDIEMRHQRVNQLLAELQPRDVRGPNRDHHIATLFHQLRADAREEEDLLLASLREVSTPRTRQAIGVLWACARALAPGRAQLHMSRRPPPKLLTAGPFALVTRLKTYWLRRHAGV